MVRIFYGTKRVIEKTGNLVGNGNILTGMKLRELDLNFGKSFGYEMRINSWYYENLNFKFDIMNEWKRDWVVEGKIIWKCQSPRLLCLPLFFLFVLPDVSLPSFSFTNSDPVPISQFKATDRNIWTVQEREQKRFRFFVRVSDGLMRVVRFKISSLNFFIVSFRLWDLKRISIPHLPFLLSDCFFFKSMKGY